MMSWMAAAAPGGGTAPIGSVRQLRGVKGTPENEGLQCCMLAQVVHASSLRRNLYLVTDPSRTRDAGVVLFAPDGALFGEGDILAVEGATSIYLRHLAIRAVKAEVVRHAPLTETRAGKYSDLRKGVLHARRVWLEGMVESITVERGVTTFTLTADRNIATCRVKGSLPERFRGKQVRVVGCVFQSYNESGVVCDPVLELEDTDDIKILNPDYRTPVIWSLSALLALVIVVLAATWLKVHREHIANAAVERERQRLAVELHDTIEQHLATVKILLSGALGLDGLPEEACETLQKAAQVLVHAKVAVRDAVMDLRRAADVTFCEGLRALAGDVSAAGVVRVFTRLADVPRALPKSRTHDILAIVREAVTNAVKHGHPKTLAIISDRCARGEGGGGGASFILRVLNDGERFDVSEALGPDAGHFGLAGMRERAARSGVALSFVNTGQWCGVRLEVEA